MAYHELIQRALEEAIELMNTPPPTAGDIIEKVYRAHNLDPTKPYEEQIKEPKEEPKTEEEKKIEEERSMQAKVKEDFKKNIRNKWTAINIPTRFTKKQRLARR